MVERTPLPPDTKTPLFRGVFVSGGKGWVNGHTGFNKFVRNEKWHMDVAVTDLRMEFEHSRSLRMTRRVEGMPTWM